jgi:hypothetical protein
LLLTLAGCDDAAPPGRGDEQNITERTDVAFDVTGSVFGLPGSDKSTWQKACDAWVAELEAIAPPNAVRSHECGTPQDVGQSGPLFKSNPVAHLVVSLPKGTKPLSFSPVDVRGTSSSLASWTTACNEEIDRIAAVYGDRMLAATCTDPAQLPGSLVQYASPLTVWIAPPAGASFEVSGFVLGTSSSVESWKSGCDAFRSDMIALSGAAHLGEYRCGQPQQAPGSFVVHQSHATATFAVPLVEGAAPEKLELGMVTGASSSVSSWQSACTAALTAAKAEHAERFLGGYCGDPKQAAGSFVRYESDAYAWLGERAPESSTGAGGAGGADGAGGAIGSGGSGGAGGGTQAPCSDPAPATSCMDRCLAMMDACDAGPVPQTCESMCGYQPTECELACGEATSCDAIQDWYDVCGLFQ